MYNVKKTYLKFIRKQESDGEKFLDKQKQFTNFYLPLCKKLFEFYKSKNKPLLIGVSGGQGSGKSTIAKIFKIILQTKFKLNIVYFSIDDFYKTIYERKKMSRLVHPLFMTRGVPGTHDVKMLYKVIKNLRQKNFNTIRIPKFDKSIDNRSKKKFWQKVKNKPDIIFFEGWCVGAKPQLPKDLRKPINILEKFEDAKLTWRKKVNNELKTNYKKIFNLIDKKVYLKVPNFDYVLKWRILQEKKLKNKTKRKTMNKKEVKRFIMFYERITKNMKKNYTKNDIIIFLDKKHKIKSVSY